jgi:hypothetical protein
LKRELAQQTPDKGCSSRSCYQRLYALAHRLIRPILEIHGFFLSRDQRQLVGEDQTEKNAQYNQLIYQTNCKLEPLESLLKASFY